MIYSIYAKTGSAYDKGLNPFGRTLLGYKWSSSPRQAIVEFAEREGLDASLLQAA